MPWIVLRTQTQQMNRNTIKNSHEHILSLVTPEVIFQIAEVFVNVNIHGIPGTHDRGD